MPFSEPRPIFRERATQVKQKKRLVHPRMALPSYRRKTAPIVASDTSDLPLFQETDKEKPSGPMLLTLPSRSMPAVKGNVAQPMPFPPARNPEAVGNVSSIEKAVPARMSEIPQAVHPPVQAAASENQAPARQGRSSSRRKKHLRRVSELRQMSAVECGACCLAMILTYYGHATSVSQVQEYCNVGRDGLTALSLVKASRSYGLRVRAVSLKQNDLRSVTLPAIVHWEFNHFVIVERWSPKRVDLVDPAVGRRRLTPEEFDEGFTGVVIMLEPGVQFERKRSTESLSLWNYLRSLPRMPGVVAQIIGTSLLLQILGLGSPLLTALVVDDIIPAKVNNLLLLLGLGMLFLILIQAVTKLLRTSLLIYLQTRIDAQMMLNFFEHLLSLPYRFFQARFNGDLLSRMDSNTAIRDLLTSQMISTLLDGSTVIVYFAILLFQSRLIAGVTIAIGAFQVALLLLTSPAIRRLTMQDLMAQGKTQGYMNEVLAGIATLKAAGAEQRALSRWTNLFFDEMNIAVRRNYLLAIVGIAFDLLQGLAPMVLLWIGARLVIDGSMSLGTMLALNTLAVSFLVPLSSLASSGQKIQIVHAHFDRLADVLKSEPEQDIQSVCTPPRLTGYVELRNVRFQYDPQSPPILQNITMRIRPGQKVALVGKTGSGKSTLGKLLIGLITPTQGSISYDGFPLQQLNYQEVRRQFGVVLQESFIFSGSVRENIAFNNSEIDMEQIVEAAKAAAIHDDIEKMPMGYETLLSEGGSVFSGGQRQRLALARALANQPAMLLLDEATSALDVATEQAVEQQLQQLSCTQIVIAHRLSTIRNADLILVLDEGRIVEQGSHDQLLRRRGFYAQLIKVQIENGEIEAA